MDFKKPILEAFSNELLLECESIYNQKSQTPQKSAKYAQDILEFGKKLFDDKEIHDDEIHASIWDCYARSKLYSPRGSTTLALSFFYNSELLFHLAKYEDCIKDTDRALEMVESLSDKVELLCRKAKCMAILRNPAKDTALEEAKLFQQKINCPNSLKEIELMIEETEQLLAKYSAEVNWY